MRVALGFQRRPFQHVRRREHRDRAAFAGQRHQQRLAAEHPADGVVYSRSGLTYQAGVLEQAGLVTRAPARDDERSTIVTITETGRARLDAVLPGRVEIVRRLLFEPLSREQVETLARLLAPIREHIRSLPPRSTSGRRGRR